MLGRIITPACRQRNSIRQWLIPLSEFIAMKEHVRTYKAIGEFVMSKIAELGEADRALAQPRVKAQ